MSFRQYLGAFIDTPIGAVLFLAWTAAAGFCVGWLIGALFRA